VRVPFCSARGTLREAPQLLPLLDRLQISQNSRNLVRVEDEFRHLRMPNGKSFGQSFRQAVDRIFARQRTKGRRCRIGTLACTRHGMAPRAVRGEQVPASLFQRAWLLALGELRHHAERNAGNPERRVHGKSSVELLMGANAVQIRAKNAFSNNGFSRIGRSVATSARLDRCRRPCA